jgi:hypothetical protein
MEGGGIIIDQNRYTDLLLLISWNHIKLNIPKVIYMICYLYELLLSLKEKWEATIID